ncbi:MFS transporter [Streptomyces sp. NBC_00503]|uniref:MFS transporter n=1 Tax=Streptomyces sp. NBC_00503 TaxID=2903659 RepID=UPI003FCCB30C
MASVKGTGGTAAGTSPGAAGNGGGRAPRRRGAPDRAVTFTAMVVAVAMIFVDQTIVSIAAPSIIEELGLSASGMQRVVNAYLLALAAFFALGGRLADIFGPRRMLVAGTLVFVVSSALCGSVPTGEFAEGWLIVFRATQGLGAALVFPAALAVVIGAFPVDERGRSLALFYVLAGSLTALGPVLGGWLTAWTWRAIFWVNVPIAVLSLVLTAVAHVPDVRRPERLDLPGAVLVAVGLGLSVLGLQQASAWGWASPATWACTLAGLLVLVLFCRHELRTDEPLIKLRVFRDRAFTADVLVLFFAMLAFVPVMFFASVYAQICLSASPDEAGFYLLYFFAGFGLSAQLGGRILDKRGARPAMMLGSAVGCVGFALWAGKLTELAPHDQWPYAALAGAGIGLLLSPAATDAANRSIDASYGEVTGITQTVRNFAAAVGMAVFGTVLVHVTTSRVTMTLTTRGMPEAEARSLARGVAEAVTGHPDDHRASGVGPISAVLRTADRAVRMDYAEANQRVFYGMAIAMAAALLCSFLHPGTRVTPKGTEESGEQSPV